MSPESPGNIVVLETWRKGDQLLAKGRRLTADQFMTVSWYSIRQPEGSHPLAGGVAYIYDDPTLQVRDIAEARVPHHLGGFYHPPDSGEQWDPNTYYWRDKALGDGLMFILLLPEGWTLDRPDPLPREGKVHQGRIAVYWKPDGKFNADVTIRWRLKPLRGDAEMAANRLNDWLQGAGHAPFNAGVTVSDDLRMRSTLLELLDARFSGAELDELCFHLGVDSENFPAEKRKRVRELIGYITRRGRLADLLAAARAARPDQEWPIA